MSEAGEDRFRLLVHGMKDYAIFMLDPQGRVLTWNEGARLIKGYDAEEIIGEHFSRFYGPEAIETGQPERELAVAAEEGRYEEEGWRVRKDGSRFLASVVITAVFDADGELAGFGKVTRDITERKEAEEQVARANAEADRQRIGRAQALEINDNIIQGLALAKYRDAAGDRAGATEAIEHTLRDARRILGQLQAAIGDTKPGDLRRRERSPEISDRFEP